jgi:hypothetical protein
MAAATKAADSGLSELLLSKTLTLYPAFANSTASSLPNNPAPIMAMFLLVWFTWMIIDKFANLFYETQ